MTFDQSLAILSALLSSLGLIGVAIQIRQATRQRWVETVQRLFDNNRELLTLGFEHPKLLTTLNDGANPDPETRYLQLWLNHLAVVHTILKHGGFDADFRNGLEADLADTIAANNMQNHWLRVGKFYPASFQKRVNAIIAKLDET